VDSFKKNVWLNEEDYEVLGDHVAINGPKKGREENVYLFKDFHIYFHGTFETPNPSLQDLTLLLKLGGGTLMKSPPTKSYLKSNENVLIVVDNEREEREIENLKKKYSIDPVNYSWLLDSTSFYELKNVEDYKIKF
jgi:hypothetical protein